MRTDELSVVRLSLDGVPTDVEEGTSVAAALINAGVWHFRTSVTGKARAPLCAMGVCFECRVMIDGHPHRRACLEICRDGMEVTTGG
jgi:predicted molibdopterin-dependent oxidoreductase YjgC